MSEPAPVWYTQCPSTYFKLDTYYHCLGEFGHEGEHWNPEGGFPERWTHVGKLERPEPKKVVAYIAGPMSGKKDWNFPAFHKAATQLRERGLVVINPAEGFGGRTDLPKEVYMRQAIQNVLKADMVYTLRGWQKSAGASLEVEVARQVGVEVRSL